MEKVFGSIFLIILFLTIVVMLYLIPKILYYRKIDRVLKSPKQFRAKKENLLKEQNRLNELFIEAPDEETKVLLETKIQKIGQKITFYTKLIKEAEKKKEYLPSEDLGPNKILVLSELYKGLLILMILFLLYMLFIHNRYSYVTTASRIIYYHDRYNDDWYSVKDSGVKKIYNIVDEKR